MANGVKSKVNKIAIISDYRLAINNRNLLKLSCVTGLCG